jgi:hypothetical protein
MLTKIEARNSQGDVLVLPMADISGGYSVQEIDGLGPVKTTIVTSKFAGTDGVQVQSKTREARNITFKIGYEPNYSSNTVSSLRDNLYDYFSSELSVDLRFYLDDGRVVSNTGHIEDFQTTIFSKTPAADISIIADPDFIELEDVTITGNSVNTTTETNVPYTGNADTPSEFSLAINRTLSQFTVYYRTPDGVLRNMDVASSFLAGDVVNINSTPGNKSITLTRNNVVSSILYAFSPQSTWHFLSKGTNTIRVYATGAAIPYTLKYRRRYGGL